VGQDVAHKGERSLNPQLVFDLDFLSSSSCFIVKGEVGVVGISSSSDVAYI
jgi:hypothetical protein